MSVARRFATKPADFPPQGNRVPADKCSTAPPSPYPKPSVSTTPPIPRRRRPKAVGTRHPKKSRGSPTESHAASAAAGKHPTSKPHPPPTHPKAAGGCRQTQAAFAAGAVSKGGGPSALPARTNDCVPHPASRNRPPPDAVRAPYAPPPCPSARQARYAAGAWQSWCKSAPKVSLPLSSCPYPARP